MKHYKIYVEMFCKNFVLLSVLCVFVVKINAQNGITNTTKSPFAKVQAVDFSDVQLQDGFWYDRVAACTQTMVPSLWNIYTSDSMCFSFRNFKVAAGIDTGRFRGPSFHDGDFYKTMEAMAANYAYTKDKALDDKMDAAIAVVAKAQKEDGYIYTKSIIEQKKTGSAKMFDDKLSFEAYNFGHLMTAACVHHRATGKSNLLDIAKKATDFLIEFYNQATPEQARNAICPSHYMGIVEMYRTTQEKKYLELIKKLIDIRGTTDGTDDNSDRIPFRKMTKVNGHAVRANYLFAGVADLYAETGDESLMKVLHLMWDDVTNKKMYITGGCGALYDGLSLEGLTYKPDSLQAIQQAYGKDFQLPNKTAHNETCANIGNLLWNWRMFLLTGDAKYVDVIELELYNAILSGVNLEGNKYFYTNPLEVNKSFPYSLRWSGERQAYISKSNCCPPNVVRTIAELPNYFYSKNDKGVFVNLYGASVLNTTLQNGDVIIINQETNYPNTGNVKLTIHSNVGKEYPIYLRKPNWCDAVMIKVNGKILAEPANQNGYLVLKKIWKADDVIEINFEMPVVLLEANPLVEEAKNQVAVKRGPVLYCVEKADVPTDVAITQLVVKSTTKFTLAPTKFQQHNVLQLQTTVNYTATQNWNNSLYKKVNTITKPITIKLTPYYAWANRGYKDMSVWLNFSK